MKVPKSFEGCMVSVQLGRPLYTFEYGAHVKARDKDLFMVVPVMKQAADKGGNARMVADASEVIIGAMVDEVTDDSVVLKLFVPDQDNKGGIVVRLVIPSALILNMIELFEYDAALPTMVRHQRTPENPKSKIIL